MKKCTGINCIMQVGTVNPADCKVADSCQYATRPVTRADHIRAMTDEELALFLSNLSDCFGCPAEEPCRDSTDGCKGGMLAYLKEAADI